MMCSEHMLALSMPGPLELIIILIIAVLLFGKRLPDVAKNMGKSLADFKQGLKEASQIKDDVTGEMKDVANLNSLNEIKDEITKDIMK